MRQLPRWASGPLGVRLAGLVFLLLAALPAQAAPGVERAPMQVSVGTHAPRGAATVYHLRVESEGAPVLVVLPDRASYAELSVNGATVQRIALDTFGLRPLGHDILTLGLAGVTPRDRIEISELGDDRAPRVLHNLGLFKGTLESGVGSGLYYGLLLALALFQLVAAITRRESPLLWYCLWITSIIAFEAIWDNFFGLSPATAAGAFVVVNVVAEIGYVGFVSTYLRLRSKAPRLFWFFLATNVVTNVSPIIIGALKHQPVPLSAFYFTGTLSIAVGMAIAILRRSAGFAPATFIAFGLVGSLSVLAAGLFRELTGVESTLLSRWSTELGFIFDFSVFSLGLVYRAHFTRIEHQRLEAELREATLAAGHDPLTGLLNRRGLEAWLKATVRHAGTVLFIDIDCFKEINDEGGHAAGDDVLTIVARIIRHAVREQDAVSRFGGDEFVVVLNGISDAALTTDVVARISSAVGFLVPLGAKSEARIGVSIGSATFGAGVTFSEALELADADAYRVKAEHHVRTRSVRQRSLTPPNAVAE